MSYERDDYEAYEFRAAAREERRRHVCQCGDDLPGHCPGPANCPYSDYNAFADDDPEPDSDRTLGLLNPNTAPRRVGY